LNEGGQAPELIQNKVIGGRKSIYNFTIVHPAKNLP
jgi:hypothetical protein